MLRKIASSIKVGRNVSKGENKKYKLVYNTHKKDVVDEEQVTSQCEDHAPGTIFNLILILEKSSLGKLLM